VAAVPAGPGSVIRAYAATLEPGWDGPAWIEPGGLLRFARELGWSRPAGDERAVLVSALAHMARAGHLDRRGRGNYHTWPEGHRGGMGVDPVIAGTAPELR
jgi:hypothetical protein